MRAKIRKILQLFQPEKNKDFFASYGIKQKKIIQNDTGNIPNAKWFYSVKAAKYSLATVENISYISDNHFFIKITKRK